MTPSRYVRFHPEVLQFIETKYEKKYCFKVIDANNFQGHYDTYDSDVENILRPNHRIEMEHKKQ